MADTQLLEIEDRLAADASGAERDAVLAGLDELKVAAKGRLDKGLPPADAKRCLALLAALDAAGLVVRQVWDYLHGRQR